MTEATQQGQDNQTSNFDNESQNRQKGTGEMFAIDISPFEYRSSLIDETDDQVDEWADASCRDETGSLTELFFSDQIPDIIRAKQICATCPLVDPCLTGAVDRREPWGVWGGQLFLNGKVLAQKRPRGRPPKNPVPGIQLTA